MDHSKKTNKKTCKAYAPGRLAKHQNTCPFLRRKTSRKIGRCEGNKGNPELIAMEVWEGEVNS